MLDQNCYGHLILEIIFNNNFSNPSLKTAMILEFFFALSSENNIQY